MYRLLLVLIVGLLGSACAPAQQIDRVADITPPKASAVAASKSTVYERTIVKSVVGEHVATLQSGLACIGSLEGAARYSQQTLYDQEYENAFEEEFAKAGYRIVNTVGSGDLFTGKKQIPSDLHIAGVITKRKMNICSAILGTKGEASLTVEWQVWDNAKKAVVYVTTQKGYAINGWTFETISVVGDRMWINAFSRAVRGLLADDGFQALMNGAPTTPVVRQSEGARSSAAPG